MAQDKDEEIAALKARLERLEQPAPVTSVRETKSGFSGGFFGCFGVLAAVALVAAGFLSLGQCAPEAEPFQAASAPDTPERAQAALGCARALVQAEAAGQVGESSAMTVPWVIEDVDTLNGVRTVRCEAMDDGRKVYVVADILCRESEQDRCVKVNRIDRP